MSNIYTNITLPAERPSAVSTQMYRGFSTVNPYSEDFVLYDYDLIKQDIINHFHVRQGERLMNPRFGTIIWDLLFEPLTEQVKDLIVRNVNEIINFDPRIKASDVVVTGYDTGIQIQCTLTYLVYNMSERMQLKFDQANGLLV